MSVNRTRLYTILIGNALAGLAGAALVVPFGTFQQNLTAGRGFIAVALVYFGAWRAFGVLPGPYSSASCSPSSTSGGHSASCRAPRRV